MANLDSLLKCRDITLPTKVHLVKAIIFPVVMYGCKIWTVKKAECWQIDAFELWCWKRLLRVPSTVGSSNQSILKEISPGCSLEDWCWSWNSHTLATSCEELTRWKRPWCWEGLGAGVEGDDRGIDGWMASLTRWAWVLVNARSLQRVGHNWATELKWYSQFSSVTQSCPTLCDPVNRSTPGLPVHH